MEFLWQDYETWGRSPRLDRPAQFAAVRTDENLEVIADPIVFHCHVAPDRLPKPSAVLVHGVTPKKAMEEGVSEAEFAGRICEELSKPNTVNVGFNAMRFDHELTRFLLYRALLDSYAWHWRDGCSRWDLIDLLRAAYALRPDGIKWPRREDGAPSFRLEYLAAANGIEHENAHDALEDVLALLSVARLLKDAQPKLFQYGLSLRSKDVVRSVVGERCFFLTSSLIPATLGCGSLVARLCRHPRNENEMLVYDLRCDPSSFEGLTAEAIEALLFTRADELPEDTVRPPIYRIKLNGCPFVAPAGVVDGAVQERLDLDRAVCEQHLQALRSIDAFAANVRAAFDRDYADCDQDVDAALYSGFIPDGDRVLLTQRLDEDVSLSNGADLEFEDERLPELTFRYRSRSFWRTLSNGEKRRWHTHCRGRHLTPGEDGRTGMDRYNDEIERLRLEHADDDRKLALLGELAKYGERLNEWLSRP